MSVEEEREERIRAKVIVNRDQYKHLDQERDKGLRSLDAHFPFFTGNNPNPMMQMDYVIK